MNAIDRALELRNTLIKTEKKFFFIKEKKVLVVDFSDTLQGKDTSRVIDLMPNVKTGEYVFRAKVNVKDIDPLAAKEYKKEFKDIKKMDDEDIENLIKREEFDFPLWFKYNRGFKMQNALDYNLPFILQVGGCNFHDGTETGGCWYCFVDDKSNDGRISHGKTWISAKETVKSMVAAREKIKRQYAEQGVDLNMKVLRISGGEPTTVLDYVLDVWRYIGRKGLNFVGQIDSNLSTGSLVDRFEREGIYEKNILNKLAEYPVKVLTAIKGVSDENIQSNVQSTATLQEQVYSIKKFLKAGFDIYPQMYNPHPPSLHHYLEMMDSEIENFSLRVHIGPLKVYGPTKQRLTFEAKRLGVEPEALIKQKQEEWNNNYNGGNAVIDNYLQKTYGVGYKDTVRSDVPLKILKS
jgi:uncharacterized Fe-S cluster-containing radical SAM superfamily protein